MSCCLACWSCTHRDSLRVTAGSGDLAKLPLQMRAVCPLCRWHILQLQRHSRRACRPVLVTPCLPQARSGQVPWHQQGCTWHDAVRGPRKLSWPSLQRLSWWHASLGARTGQLYRSCSSAASCMAPTGLPGSSGRKPCAQACGGGKRSSRWGAGSRGPPWRTWTSACAPLSTAGRPSTCTT